MPKLATVFFPFAWMKHTNYSRRKVPCSTLLWSTSVFLPSFLGNLPTGLLRIIQEQKRGREYEFATSFVQTKKNANLSSPLDFVLLFLDRSKLADCHNWPAELVSSQMENGRSTFYKTQNCFRPNWPWSGRRTSLVLSNSLISPELVSGRFIPWSFRFK